MQPGDIYGSPTRRRPPPIPDPYHSSPGPSTSYPQMSQVLPNNNPYDPYNNPQPQSPPSHQIHHSQSQPFPPGPNATAAGYGDPFNQPPLPDQSDYVDPPGSRHYPSHPNLTSPTMPASGSMPFPQGSPRLSYPPTNQNLQQGYGSPQRPPSAGPAGPRTRFDSNPNFNTSPRPSNSPYVGGPAPTGDINAQRPVGIGQIYPPAHRLSTPQNSGYGRQDDDLNDSAPLLSHATPDSRFGISQSNSAMSLGNGRYQLSDVGTPSRVAGDGSDLGMIPGAWNGQPNGGGMYDDEQDNVHYGPLPTRMVRRNRTQKKVALFRGHLVFDVDVPSMLLDQCPVRDGNEFTKMRYSAVTCDPDDFVDDKYTLRQRLYDPPRQTELFIVITMYNEDDVLFCRTMRGVMQNIAHLCTRDRSKTWGRDGWKKVVVCIVADGRLKINPRTRSVLAALGVYQDGVAKNAVNGVPVRAHVFEYTTQLAIGSEGKIKAGDSRYVPIQMIFCLKEKNQKKINSHRWFFNAFGACLRPNVCVLLDVGTQPGSDSIYHLWKAFDINSSVGGACGEIVALKGMFWKNLLNPLVAAQNFEYKMSNILDKPLESVFGYITVLPGAFSAYRYIALLNDEKGNGPLKQYFIGETMHGSGAGIFAANMYLAEDRILCWELVSKRNCKWKLHYVKSAYAITDVPDAVPELVAQRRRWLNGSFFAAIHSIFHFGYLYRSSHSFSRKFFLHIELFYQTLNNLFAWFALGNFYIAFVVLTNSLDTLGNAWHYVNIPLQYVYVALLVLCFILSLGNRPAGSKIGYTVSMLGFAGLTIYMLFAAVYLAVVGIEGVEQNGITVDTVFGNKIFRNIILSLAATYGLYILASILALEPWHMITSFVQYLLLAPSYINVLNVYAFCNVHDVSWGTKGSDSTSTDLGDVSAHKDNKDEVTVEVPTEQTDINQMYAAELKVLASKPPPEVKTVSPDQAQEDYYKNFRTNVLIAWVMSNGALAAAILRTSGGKDSLATTYMGILLYTVAGLAFFRFLGSTAYLVVRLFAGE